MSEIEKMYENVMVEPINFAKQGAIDFTNTIEIDGKRYSDFTAEKQIEIIKFLISKHARFDMFKNYEQKDLYMVHYECRYFPKQYLPFGEALAESINYLWQYLTEKEKQQIKDILK